MRRAVFIAAFVPMLALYACSKSYAEEDPTQTPTRADAEPNTGDGNGTSDVVLPKDDASPTDAATGPCLGRTSFTEVSDTDLVWSAGYALTSARLASDNVWYVTVEKGMDLLVAVRMPKGNVLVPLDNVNVTGESNEQAATDDAVGRLLLQSTRGTGDRLYVSTASGKGGFDTAKPLVVDNADDVVDPYLVNDVLYYARATNMGHRALWRGQLVGTDSVAETRVALASGTDECDHPTVTRDQLEVFFRLRTANDNFGVVTHAKRTKVTEPFATPTTVSLPAGIAHPTWVSPDGCELYAIDAAKKLRHFTRKLP